MEYKSIYAHFVEIGQEVNSMFQNKKAGRRHILEFMDANDWFGMEHRIISRTPHMAVHELQELQESITLWLSAYKQPARKKITLMLEHFKYKYPETCKLYEQFISNNKMADKPAGWMLLDFILSEIDREITEYDESGLQRLIHRLDEGATRKAAQLFADFLGAENQDGESISVWKYTFNIRDNPSLIHDAYPATDFAAMAYCVFNEDMWVQHDLIRKAVNSETCANLWLFVALHFICALRAQDMARLPAPALPREGKIIFKEVMGRDFTEHDAILLVEEFIFRLNLNPIQPSKTAKKDNIPEIKLFVPESLKSSFGIIMAITLAHRKKSQMKTLLKTIKFDFSSIHRFFGGDFVKALGISGFSTRRCNKSFLQGIEAIVGNEHGKPKGYMLAALARSHKGGVGKLADMTEIYLKDAQFGGYSPEFIIRQMFERGVFSFIPVVLLEMYTGDNYTKLPITKQTQLIGEVGLTAYQIENMAQAMERAIIKSRVTVKEIIQNPSAVKENAARILQNIASGASPGKQSDYFCLMIAAGLSCPFAARSGCLGCGYEIQTKATMHTLMREHKHLMVAKTNATPEEIQRYELIIRNAILPAAAEIITSAELLYPDADVDGLLDIMEVELYGADCISGRC